MISLSATSSSVSDISAPTRVLNPRSLPLPTANELEAGINGAPFRGVTYRKDRANTRPWVARYLDRTVGNYKTPFDAATARWICSKYNCDVMQEDDGSWCGQVYQGKEQGNLVITRFAGTSEEDVLRQLEQHQYGKTKSSEPHNKSIVAPLSLANPRREAVLPSELPRTSGRGQYRGVTESKGRYSARWNNKLHLGTYDTAFAAGLTVYIAEHYDRDIEADAHGGFKGRAYKTTADKPSLQHFRAGSEQELTRLIDAFHGIAGRAGEPVAAPPSLDQAIQQFWSMMWAEYSLHDGNIVCGELYRMWQLFLAHEKLGHLVNVKEKAWCSGMERQLGLQQFSLPFNPQHQSLAVPKECRAMRKESKENPKFITQWRATMAASCSPEVCVRAWSRRRLAATRRDVIFRQGVIEEEIANRKELKERCPEWEDSWEQPMLLPKAQLWKAVASEAARVNDETLARWLRLDPDNDLFKRELKKRDSNVDDEHLHKMPRVMSSNRAGLYNEEGQEDV